MNIGGKNVMQGKSIAVTYTLRTHLNQFSLEFVNKNRCISVRSVSEDKLEFFIQQFEIKT